MPKFIVRSFGPLPRPSLRGWVVLLACMLAGACTSVVPKELNDARDAYSLAAEGPAANYSVSQLRTAQKALERAEQAFRDQGNSPLTRERALEALHAARLASAKAKEIVARADDSSSTGESP